MELVSFKVSNYRSIVETTTLQIDNYSVIVGPNNSGKSNLLKALDTSLNMVKNIELLHKKSSTGKSYRFKANRYNWQSDIPVNLNTNPRARTEFVMKFKLTKDELDDFYELYGSKLGGYLPVRFRLNKLENIIDFPIQGKAKSVLMKNTREISRFIMDKISHIYIPCVRTSELSANTIEELIYLEYNKLSNIKEYSEAKEIVQRYEESILSNIEIGITDTINKFIPSVNSVKLKTSIRTNSFFRTSDIEVDDGVVTSLDAKGDGISSLFAIAFMEYVSSASAQNKNLIVLIEEPEAHLHSTSIHYLREVLRKSSINSKIVISTHSPILVERHKIENNILVDDSNGKIDNVKRLSDIRKSLGVQISDNLTTSEFCILVEGQSEVRFINKIFENELKHMNSKLHEGSVIIFNMQGGSKASFYVNIYKTMLTDIYLIVDNDSCGKAALKECFDRKLIEVDEFTIINSIGLLESELEDLFDLNKYSDRFLYKFGVDLTADTFKKGKNSWSERVQRSFIMQGKIWDEYVEKEAKTFMMDLFVEIGCSFIHDSRKSVYESLIENINRRLKVRFNLA